MVDVSEDTKGSTKDGLTFLVVASVIVFPPTFAIGAVLDNYIDSLLIWGGADCTAVDGVQTCFGYPPTGFILIGLVVGMLVLPVAGKLYVKVSHARV